MLTMRVRLAKRPTSPNAFDAPNFVHIMEDKIEQNRTELSKIERRTAKMSRYSCSWPVDELSDDASSRSCCRCVFKDLLISARVDVPLLSVRFQVPFLDVARTSR